MKDGRHKAGGGYNVWIVLQWSRYGSKRVAADGLTVAETVDGRMTFSDGPPLMPSASKGHEVFRSTSSWVTGAVENHHPSPASQHVSSGSSGARRSDRMAVK